MTEKAYFAEPLVLSFQATIQAVSTRADDMVDVVMDRTFFYPTGGGQSHDTGTINGLPVLDVRSENGAVLHAVRGSIAAGSAICQIDRAHRFGNMFAHTGQHILSAAFVHVLQAETVAVKMNAAGTSTVDIALGNLSPEQIEQVETQANAVIMENREIRSYFVSATDPRLDELRRAVKFEKVSGDVRLVEIMDWDVSACAGTHFPTTGMLGLLRIVKAENYKGGSRIYFVAGTQALEFIRRYQNLLDQTAATLSSAPDDVPMLVAKLLTEKQELTRQISAQRETLLRFERDQLLAQAVPVSTIQLATAAFHARGAEDLRVLANQLAEHPDAVAVLVNQQGEQLSVTISAAAGTGIHAGNLLKAVLESFGGRGGGRDTYAQGACQGTDPTSVLNAAHALIQATLQS
jgi:alanyl-tRNA synthetase